MFLPKKIEMNSYIKNFYIFLIYTIPLAMFSSFILNLFLVIMNLYFLSFVLFKSDFSWIKDNINKTLICFGIYITIQSFFLNNEFSFFKSIFYIKFIIFFISVKYFFEKFQIKLEKLFGFYLLIILLFAIDLSIQFLIEKNLFGFPCQMNCQRFSGLFAEELVAGSFLFFFGFVANSYFLIQKKINLFFLSFLVITVLIFITGDRTPFISIFFLIFFYLILNRQLRLKTFYLLSTVLIIFIVIINTSAVISDRYIVGIKNMLNSSELDSISLKTNILDYESKINELRKDISIQKEKNFDNQKNYQDLEVLIFEKNKMIKRLKKVERVEQYRNKDKWYYKLYDTVYGAHYLTTINIIKDNFIFGAGVRSFRIECSKYENLNSLNVDSRCSTHPHNLHLEILSEVGLVGYILLLISIILLLSKFKNRKILTELNIYLLCIFLVLIFPFKPSGAFFSSWAGFIFWYSFGLSNYLASIKNK